MAKLSPMFNEPWVDANGDPYSGAQLFTYAAGSSTKQATYKDSGSATAHANPIILNSRGIADEPIWLTSGETYKFVLAPSGDTDPPASAIDTFDNIEGINDTTVTIDQWVSGPTPTYVSGTSFTLVGDQSSIFHVGRRLKTTNTGGTIYSTITAVAYTSLTTVTVSNDSGSLDSGLSAVSYALLSATNPSVPSTLTLTSLSMSGNYTNTGQPAFLAYNATDSANVTGNGTVATVPFGTEIYDQGDDFASNTFTAPVTGKYDFSATVRLEGLTAAADTILLELVTTNHTYEAHLQDTNDLDSVRTISVTVLGAPMTASDTAFVRVTVTGEASDVVDISGDADKLTFFSGALRF